MGTTDRSIQCVGQEVEEEAEVEHESARVIEKWVELEGEERPRRQKEGERRNSGENVIQKGELEVKWQKVELR